MIDGISRSAPTARINVNFPYFNGEVEAICIDDPVYDSLSSTSGGTNGFKALGSLCAIGGVIAALSMVRFAIMLLIQFGFLAPSTMPIINS